MEKVLVSGDRQHLLSLANRKKSGHQKEIYRILDDCRQSIEAQDGGILSLVIDDNKIIHLKCS